jgi:hypothetical protein
MYFVFIVLGELGLLPIAALITALVLGGFGFATMAIINIVNDIGIIRRMLSAPRAYLTALVPASRYKMLLANVAVMTILDFVTMAVVISGQVWLAFNLGGNFAIAYEFVEDMRLIDLNVLTSVISGILLLMSGYLLLIMFIVSCIAVRRSLFYQKRAGGLLTALVAIGAIYLWTLSHFLLAPFGTVTRIGMFFSINVGGTGMLAYVILTFICAVMLFILNSKLIERKLNL